MWERAVGSHRGSQKCAKERHAPVGHGQRHRGVTVLILLVGLSLTLEKGRSDSRIVHDGCPMQRRPDFVIGKVYSLRSPGSVFSHIRTLVDDRTVQRRAIAHIPDIQFGPTLC